MLSQCDLVALISCLIQLPLPSCLGHRKEKNLYQAKEDSSQFVGAEVTGHCYTEDAHALTGAWSVKQGIFRGQCQIFRSLYRAH